MALQGPEELGEQLEEPEDLDDQDASSISPAEEITLPSGLGGDDDAEEALLLPWDRFSAWLHCICVVGFDLELGQAVEVRGPTRLCKPPSHLAENAQVSSSSGGIRLFPGLEPARLSIQLFLLSCLAEQTLKLHGKQRESVPAPGPGQHACVRGSRSAPAASLPGVNLVSKNRQNKLKTVHKHTGPVIYASGLRAILSFIFCFPL